MGLLDWFVSVPPKKVDAQTEEARLMDALMGTTSLTKCLTIYQQALPGSSLEKAASLKVWKLANTFADWETVTRALPSKDVLFIPAVESMFRLAGMCSQMETIVRLCPHEIPVHAQALGKMADKAKSFKEWLLIFSLAPAGSEISKRAEVEVEKHATTFKQWEEVWDNISDPVDSVLEAKALQMCFEKATTLDEFSSVFGSAPEGSPLEHESAEKFEKVEASFDDYLAFYENGDADQTKHERLMEIVLEKLLEKAGDHEDLVSVYDAALKNESEEDTTSVFKEMIKRWFPKEIWQEIRNNADAGSLLESHALSRLVLSAESVDELLELYIEYVEQETNDDDVLGEMLDAITQKATVGELKIIVRLGDCGASLDDLVERAEKKLAPKKDSAPTPTT